LIFLEQNPAISSFDLYRPAREYLKDSAKFQYITIALKAAPHAVSKKHDNNDQLVDLTGSGDITHPPCPAGNKKSKRREEKEKNIGNVTDAIRGSITAHDSNSSASAVVGAALGQFTSLIAEA